MVFFNLYLTSLQITPHLDRIWSLCFKVLDDIKESVRAAAAELSRVLIGTLLRTLESGDASADTGKTMLKSVLPFLLSTQGLESAAKETQMISIHTLLEIIKKAKGSALRPFIPDLVESLLSLLTSFEGEAVNYIHMNAAKYNLTEQKIDEMRLTNIRGSPLMEAIERCLDLLDEETMKELTIKIQSVMKTAVGMPSKVSTDSEPSVTFLFKPYADTFLTLIPRHVSDRNEMVSSSYAASLGYVARSASDEAILKVAKHVSKLYFESDDDRSRIIAGEIVRAVAKHATDRFASLASAFLPLVFTARNDENKDVKQLFKDTWTDNTGGDRAASLYLREIVMLANEHLTSKRWVIKHGAALAVAEAMGALVKARGSGDITEAEADMVWPALKLALAEKSWDGKEQVLIGLSIFVKNASAYCRAHPVVATDIPKVSSCIS
jgi:proteasome component ECM29